MIYFKPTRSYQRADVIIKRGFEYGHCGWVYPNGKIAYLSIFAMQDPEKTRRVSFHEVCHVYGIGHNNHPDSLMGESFNINGQILEEDLHALEQAVIEKEKNGNRRTINIR